MSRNRCERCSTPTDQPLCLPCAVELSYRMLQEDNDMHPECAICGAAFDLTEARVIRHAKTPRAGNPVTPFLCWVCTRLHNSARSAASEAYV